MHKHDKHDSTHSYTVCHTNAGEIAAQVDTLTDNFVNMTSVNTGKPEEEVYPTMVFEIAAEQHIEIKPNRYFKKHIEVDPNDRKSL